MVIRTFTKIALVQVLLFSPNIFASSIGSSPVNPVIALLKMSLALAVVLGFLWGFAALLKRFHTPSHQSKDGLSLVSTFSLGQREKLVVVQVGNEQLLLGVSSSSISKIHVLPTPLNLQNTGETGSFKNALNAALNREVSK